MHSACSIVRVPIGGAADLHSVHQLRAGKELQEPQKNNNNKINPAGPECDRAHIYAFFFLKFFILLSKIMK